MLKKLAYSSAHYHQHVDSLWPQKTSKIEFCLLNKKKPILKETFHFITAVLWTAAISLYVLYQIPFHRLLNRMLSCIYSFRLITCSFEYFLDYIILSSCSLCFQGFIDCICMSLFFPVSALKCCTLHHLPILFEWFSNGLYFSSSSPTDSFVFFSQACTFLPSHMIL